MALYKGEDKIKDIYLGDVPIFKVYAGEEFCGFFTFSAYNLISNSDLLIDSDSDGVPDGFGYNPNTTDKTLVNGIAKFTPTASNADIFPLTPISNNIGDKIYFFAYVKSTSSNTFLLVYNPTFKIYHSGSGNFELLSIITDRTTNSEYMFVRDSRTSDWTPIEVDYIGAINITDLVSRGILPSGLTNSQYKDILDNYFDS